MNVAVAQYYRTVPLEKVSAQTTGYDVSEVLEIRAAYVALRNGVELTKVSSKDPKGLAQRVKESQDWLAVWDEGERLGRDAAVSRMKQKVLTYEYSPPNSGR